MQFTSIKRLILITLRKAKILLKKALSLYALLTVVCFAYMLSYRATKEDEDKWITVHQLGEYLSFFVNNDSYDVISLETNPEKIPSSYLKSRPLLMYFSSLVYHGAHFLVDMTGKLTGSEKPLQLFKSSQFNYMLFYHVLLNFTIVVGCVSLLHYLLRSTCNSHQPLILWGSGLIMMTDSLIRGYLLSATWMMFHLLVPISLVWCVWQLLQKPMIHLRYCMLLGSANGTLALVYPGYLQSSVLFCLFLGFLYFSKNGWKWNAKDVWEKIKSGLCYNIFFALPIGLWGLVVMMQPKIGKVAEISNFKLFVWIYYDVVDHGVSDLLMNIFSRALNYGSVFLQETGLLIGGLALLISGSYFQKVKIFSQLSEIQKCLLYSIGLCLLVSVTFWFFMGLYVWNYSRASGMLLLLLFAFLLCRYRENARSTGQKIYSATVALALLASHLLMQFVFSNKVWS